MRAVPLLLCLLLAGCAVGPAPAPAAPTPKGEFHLGSVVLHHGGTQGGLALLHMSAGEASVEFPPGVLILNEEGTLRPATGSMALTRGRVVQYLPPYGATEITLRLTEEGATNEHVFPLLPGKPFLDGSVPVDLLRIQNDEYPHRTPGQPNYAKAVSYFERYFAELGYEVETFRAPLPLALPVGGLNTESVTSVVATKRGTLSPERYLAFGGHFDVVPETTHGAFDNTGGTMATLAMAKAFSTIKTDHTLIFAAWGGEEDGILGSQAWVTAHPEIIPFLDLYVNFDVTGLAWPAPLSDPAPIVAATGPDGPIGAALAQHHATVVSDWMQLDIPFLYEGVGQGQATGAGVNAQSDHTPFLMRGVPVLFQFTANVADAFTLIHQETDTLANMTAFALRGPEAVGEQLTAAEVDVGERALAKSFESQMVPAFYLAVLTDAGVIPNARPASFPPVFNARS